MEPKLKKILQLKDFGRKSTLGNQEVRRPQGQKPEPAQQKGVLPGFFPLVLIA